MRSPPPCRTCGSAIACAPSSTTAAGVRVQVEGEVELSGVAAVVALPARVAAGMRFDPFLPDDLATALYELPMGVASKLAVPVEGASTPRAVQSAELPFWCWIAFGGDGPVRRCLAAFAGSELAQESLGTAGGDPGPWLDRLCALNPDVTPCGTPVLKSWALDPMAMGAYAAWDNRSWDRMEQFQRTVGRLAFAGEHTAGPDHHGTMEGALRSGAPRGGAGARDAGLTAARSEPIRCSPAPTSGRAENRDVERETHGRRRRR